MRNNWKHTLAATCAPVSGVAILAMMAVPAAAQEARVDDIIVTAQKREERLKDVPIPVSAVDGQSLLDTNQTTAQAFFAAVPGINLQFQNNRSQLAIRGVSTGPVSGNPVVGYVIDDVPYGSSTGQGGLFGAAPDLDPSDLARIEVLRGPQGTLYGAASMGGLIKYVTVDPDLTGVHGEVGGGIAFVNQGGEPGYNVRAAVNTPLGDTVAVRASGFTRREAGYIDNVRTGVDDVNSSRVSGGRLSLLWKPSSAFSLKLGAMYQVRDIYGSSNVDSTTGSFVQQTDMPGTGRSRSETQMYTANIKARLGPVDLTSITAYSRSTNYDVLDFTASPLVVFAPVFPTLFPGISPIGDVFRQGYNVNKFSHESRLSGVLGGSIDWVVGGFYTHEDAKYDLDNWAIDPATGATLGVKINDGTGPQPGTIIVWRDTVKYDEYAAFGNLTVRFSDRFDVQLGGRYSHNQQKMVHHEWFQNAPYPGAPDEGINKPTASGDAFTYQISPRFKPSPDHMIYGRVASGYRTGGTNAVCGTFGTIDVPCQFKPDKTVNYELGAKGSLFDSKLSYDVSVFQIDWKDIQIVQVLNAFTYNGNAGKARSRGFEASLELHPTDNLKLSAWWSHVEATLREEFVDANFFAQKGDRLPYSSEDSGRFSIENSWPLSETTKLTVGGSVTYVGDRLGEFVPFAGVAPLRAVYPDYVQFDVNAGVHGDHWNANLFVQNLTNTRGVIGGGFWNQTSFNADWFNYAQPRTVGLTIGYTF